MCVLQTYDSSALFRKAKRIAGSQTLPTRRNLLEARLLATARWLAHRAYQSCLSGTLADWTNIGRRLFTFKFDSKG